MLQQSPPAELNRSIRGKLILPDSDEYDEARRVYNATIDKHPQAIVRCANVTDVIATVKFARDNASLLAVRGGGHNGAGLAMCDGGIVADLSEMRRIHVDPVSKTVRVEAGCTWGM